MAMNFHKKVTQLTPEVAKKLTEKNVHITLSNTISEYVYERLGWLLKDLGKKEFNDNDNKIAGNISDFVKRKIAELSYDDAKEMAIALANKDRFSKNKDPLARYVLIRIISETMKQMNLGPVRFNSKTGERGLQTID